MIHLSRCLAFAALVGTGLPFILTGASTAASRAARAEPASKVAAPAGLFECKGPEQTPEREVNFPFLSGWLVRPEWSQVEPAEGKWDWRYIEGELALAKRLNKKITLSILGGPQTPDWVYQAGARDFKYSWGGRYRGNSTAQIPLLWDPVYLEKWTACIQALGQRFAGEETITLVHITGATENGLEMQLPASASDRPRWGQVGYSENNVITAWNRIVDAFGRAFPNKPLDIDIHPVLGSENVAEQVTAHGATALGQRFGVFGGWLSGKPASVDRYHAGVYTLAQKFGRTSFADFQLIGNETRQPERFAGGIEGAIAQGRSWGARYFEVWRADVLNPQLHPVLTTLAAELKQH